MSAAQPVPADAWRSSREITLLRKGGNASAATALAEEALLQFPESEPVRSALAWALYDRDIKVLKNAAGTDDLKKAWRSCKRMRELLDDDLYGRFSAWVPAVLGLASALLDATVGNQGRNTAAARELLEGLDPAELSTETFGDVPSPMERYALRLSKALQQLGAWSDLRQLCEQALPRVAGRRETELWLHHRLGLALLQLDESGAALEHFEYVLARKSTQWWAHYNVGLAKDKSDDTEGALREFAYALQGGDLHKKTHVMVSLAARLRARGELEMADRHHRIARQLRIDHGWKSTPEIDGPLGARASEPALDEDLPRLKMRWDELTAVPREQGRILKVFNNGGAGFIALDRGTDVYFAMPRETMAPPEGTRVSCRVVPSFDRKKGQASEKAVDVDERT